MDINNKTDFFKNIQLDANGNIIAVIASSPTLPIEKGVNERNTFKKLELTVEGYLKIYNA